YENAPPWARAPPRPPETRTRPARPAVPRSARSKKSHHAQREACAATHSTGVTTQHGRATRAGRWKATTHPAHDETAPARHPTPAEHPRPRRSTHAHGPPPDDARPTRLPGPSTPPNPEQRPGHDAHGGHR